MENLDNKPFDSLGSRRTCRISHAGFHGHLFRDNQACPCAAEHSFPDSMGNTVHPDGDQRVHDMRIRPPGHGGRDRGVRGAAGGKFPVAAGVLQRLAFLACLRHAGTSVGAGVYYDTPLLQDQADRGISPDTLSAVADLCGISEPDDRDFKLKRTA